MILVARSEAEVPKAKPNDAWPPKLLQYASGRYMDQVFINSMKMTHTSCAWKGQKIGDQERVHFQWLGSVQNGSTTIANDI